MQLPVFFWISAYCKIKCNQLLTLLTLAQTLRSFYSLMNCRKRVTTWAVFNKDTRHSDITLSHRRPCSIRTGIPTDSVWCPSVIITKDKWLHKLSASIKRGEMYQYASSFLTMKSKAWRFNESVLWGTAKSEVVKWCASRISMKWHHIAFLNIMIILSRP